MRTRPVFIWYIAGAWITLSAHARADQRDVVGVPVQVRHQVRHVHARLAVLAPLAMAAQAERVALEELAVDLAEAGRQRLAVEPVQERLGVEQVHLARTAGHEQEDAALGLRGEMRRLRRQRVGRRPGGLAARRALQQRRSASSPNPLPVRARNSRRFSGLIGGGAEQGPGQR